LCRITSKAFLSFIIQYNEAASQQRHKESDSIQLCTPLPRHLLGPPEVHLEEERLTFPTGKALALLICLALEVG
jgi:hypothetical protein